MDEWMEGWMDGWKEGWVGGWADGWMDLGEWRKFLTAVGLTTGDRSTVQQ